MTRRTFLMTPSAAALAAAGLMTPSAAALAAAGAFPLGINTYCLRALRWNDAQLLDFAASLNLDAVFLQDSLDPQAQEPAHWAEVRARAERLKLRLQTGAGSVFPRKPEDFDGVVAGFRKQIERAAAMGSPVVRVNFAGQRSALPAGSSDFYISTAVRVFRAVADDLRRHGMKTALETHKDLFAWEFKEIAEAAGRDIVGIYLDPTNPLYLGEHPLTTLETLAPYAVTLHLGDACVYETPRGIWLQRVPLGQGNLPLQEMLGRAAALCPNVSVHVKTICGRPNERVTLEDKSIEAGRAKLTVAERERFAALARGGQPFAGSMVVEDLAGRQLAGPLLTVVQNQQKAHIEQGVVYARTTLGLGLRGS